MLKLFNSELELLKICVPMIRHSLGSDDSPFQNIGLPEDEIEKLEFELIRLLNTIETS